MSEATEGAADRKSGRSKGHSARFADAAIHFTMSTHTRKPVKIARASRRLLARDIAVSAAWPSEDKIRVSSRLSKRGRELQRFRSTVERLDVVMRERTWKSFAQLISRHPGQIREGYSLVASKKAWPALQRLFESNELSSVVKFTMRRPLFASLYVWPNISLKRVKGGDDSEPVPEPLGEMVPHDESWRDDVLKPIHQADELYLQQQVLSAAEREQDADLFGGYDREYDGFVRLSLRDSYHDIFIPGRGDETAEVVFEPRVFLHESGVAVLTIRISAGGPLSTNELIDLMWGPSLRVARSRMAEPLVRKTWLSQVVTFWGQDKDDAGARQALIEWGEGISMSDILHAHMQLIARASGRSFRHSLVYPVSIIQIGDCCSPVQFKKNHSDDVQRIVMRMQTSKNLAPHMPRQLDLSSTEDHSLFVTLGSSAYFQWSGKRPLGIPELHTTLVIEYGLTLYKRLQAMEEDVSRMRLGERRLRRRYRNAILLFSELRQGDVRAGTAREIVRYLLRDMGADEMRPTIESALNLSSMAHGTLSAEKASRRAWWLALVGTVVAAIVSVPTIADLLRSLPEHDAGKVGEFVLTPLRHAASLEFWGPWLVVGEVSIGLLALWFFGQLVRNWPRLALEFRRGYAWPTQLEIRHEPGEVSERIAD